MKTTPEFKQPRFAARLSLFLWITLALASTGLRAGSVKLAWDPSPDSGITGYNIYRSDTSGGPYRKLNESPVSIPAYVDTTAQSGHLYFYVVKAVNLEGIESGPSNELKVNIAEVEPVSGGTALLASAGADLSAKSGEIVVLSGSSWSPTEQTPAYSWKQTSGLSVQLSGTDTANPSFVAPAVQVTVHLTFELSLTDSQGNAATDTVQVTVNPGQ